MTQASPTLMCDPSAFSTAPYMMRARGPTRTSPTGVAVGATNAVASTEGVMPRCLISMPTILLGAAVQRDNTLGGSRGTNHPLLPPVVPMSERVHAGRHRLPSAAGVTARPAAG